MFTGGVFPKGDKYDAHKYATLWAKSNDTESGMRKVVSYNNNWYLIEALEDMPFGYQVIEKIPQEYYSREISQYGKVEGYTSSEDTFVQNASLSSKRNRNVDGGRIPGYSGTQYGREGVPVRGLVADKNGEQRDQSDNESSVESGYLDQQKASDRLNDQRNTIIYDKKQKRIEQLAPARIMSLALNQNPFANDSISDDLVKSQEEFKESSRSAVTNFEDSSGRKLSEKQSAYFKDSKVRDENGRLLVVYHGTDAEFDQFELSKAGDNGRREEFGFYFTDDQRITKQYGGRQIEAYLNIGSFAAKRASGNGAPLFRILLSEGGALYRRSERTLCHIHFTALGKQGEKQKLQRQ